MAPEFKNAVKKARLLSPRQKQVLKALAEGWERKEIAEELGISKSTVNNHCQSIFSELSVNNRVEAARIAVEAYGLK